MDQPLDNSTGISPEALAEMSPEQLDRLHKEQEFRKEHAGHESQHETMAFVLIFSLFAAQFLILFWKKKHFRSYQAFSLGGLWLIPFIFGLTGEWWRFLAFWSIYSVINCWVIYKASRAPLDGATPRLVYRWFTIVYNASFVVGVTGYVIVMLVLFNVATLIFDPKDAMSAGILFLSYGLYFGVLGRDFVEICSDRMAATVGYYSKDGFPRKHLRSHICAVCNQATSIPVGSLVEPDPTVINEPVHHLECKHVFHEKCIRGWCLIGKKDICPYCKEKVDLKQFQKNPWDTQQQLYLNLLDGVRYLVVWQPVSFKSGAIIWPGFGLVCMG
ncbi:hypothetical protein BC936DRAFT_140889 [Jimgerdemannia flammicorona]|uniref:RING-type domain-containing protein n=1 Tax=Jimgerdemannia flammicorona TaxID=994334 RepID=A0A433A391_9FUNG|nr:hypothetical protein BC936DRAFT_140889 [Jimgerdemannia flammicorona]